MWKILKKNLSKKSYVQELAFFLVIFLSSIPALAGPKENTTPESVVKVDMENGF